MRASQLDKLITIEEETTTINSVGTPTEGYSLLKETNANVRVLSGASEYSSEGVLPFTKVEFTVRYDNRINYKCRIKHDNQDYTISHIQQIGRKHFIKISSIVWEGENENG